LASVAAGFLAMLALTLPALANVHAGDQLDVTVFNHPDLSRKVTVDSSGRIAYPLIGSLSVGDAAPEVVARRLATALSYYVNDARVDVQLVGEGTSINVAGGPGGKIPYTPGETLMTAMATFKTVDDLPIQHSRVDLSRVGVQHDAQTVGTFNVAALSASGGTGPALQPGDTIVLVDKPNAVRVEGAVLHPGVAYLAPSEPLSEAVTQLGGPLPTAADGHLTLVRDGVSTRFSTSDPTFFNAAHNGDTIIVPPAPRVTVTGMVTTPSTVSLKSNDTVIGAIYTAGGPTKDADLRHISVVHADGTRSNYDLSKAAQGDPNANGKLADGDMVSVPQSHRLEASTIWGILGAISGLGFIVR
jgi:polysaccharide export outer membrane protein